MINAVVGRSVGRSVGAEREGGATETREEEGGHARIKEETYTTSICEHMELGASSYVPQTNRLAASRQAGSSCSPILAKQRPMGGGRTCWATYHTRPNTRNRRFWENYNFRMAGIVAFLEQSSVCGIRFSTASKSGMGYLCLSVGLLYHYVRIYTVAINDSHSGVQLEALAVLRRPSVLPTVLHQLRSSTLSGGKSLCSPVRVRPAASYITFSRSRCWLVRREGRPASFSRTSELAGWLAGEDQTEKASVLRVNPPSLSPSAASE